MLSGSFSSKCVTDTPTHWTHTQISPFIFLWFVSVWELVAILRLFLMIFFFIITLFNAALWKNMKSPSRHLSLSSFSPRLAPMASFLSTYRFHSLFAFSFPALITSFPFCVLTPSASLFLQTENITLHSEKAHNGVGLFPADSPRQTHTHTLFVQVLFKESLCS